MKRLDNFIERLLRSADWFEIEVPFFEPAILTGLVETFAVFALLVVLFSLVSCL